MEGVVGVLMLFIFVCIGFPKMVKNRPQFYAAFMLVAGAVLLNVLAWVFGSPWGSGDDHSPSGFFKLMYVFIGISEVAAFVLLVLATGGLSIGELTGELANTIEVIRRGEDKPVIVPLRGEQPKRKAEPEVGVDRMEIGDEELATPAAPAVPKPVIRAPQEEDRTIPLE